MKRAQDLPVFCPNKGLRAAVALAALAVAPVQAQAQTIEASVGSGWQLQWNDEFDQADVDPTKWGWESNCWGGGNNELQCYTDRKKNSFIEDGKLIIRAHKETYFGSSELKEVNPDAEKKYLPYTSARLRTLNKGDWTYGRFEIRAKLPAGQGMWPAIWMLPSDQRYGGWAAGGEIDIVEGVSMDPADPNKVVYGTLHYGAQWPGNVHSGEGYTFQDGKDPTTGFHTYAIEWGDDEIRWYIDETHFATQRASGWYSHAKDSAGVKREVGGSAPFDQPFHLLLNLAVGGNWPGSPDDSVEFPKQMEVDFVRVFSCPDSPESLSSCASISELATVNVGKKAPRLINAIDFDPDFIKAQVVDVFADESIAPFQENYFSNDGSVDIETIAVEGRGNVAQVTFNTNQGGAYWQGTEGFDFGDFKALEFDLRVVSDPRASGGMMFKVDCQYPCSTGDVPLETAPVGEWRAMRFEFSELVRRAGSTLDIRNIDTPLVILPTWDNQQGVVLQIDNLRIVR